jgi:hypothetical protein
MSVIQIDLIHPQKDKNTSEMIPQYYLTTEKNHSNKLIFIPAKMDKGNRIIITIIKMIFPSSHKRFRNINGPAISPPIN